MSFLTPMTALAAAAVTVPLLFLLYLLKLRRRYLRVASTMLWQRAYEDVEVNTPFQRLRYSSLLALQLLLLLALLAAMARPVMEGEHGAADRLILLIDRSASMNATDSPDDRSRLDQAKAQAVDAVQRLGRSGGTSQVMVIAFARTAHVMTSFTYDRTSLVRAINAIEPTDETADLAAALQLASSFVGDSEQQGGQQGEVVLFSDGAMAASSEDGGYQLRAGRFRFVQVGPAADDAVENVGIVSFSARRDYDDPARVLVFVRLANAGKSQVQPVVTLRVDGEPADIRQITIPAATDETAGETTANFSLELNRQHVLSVQHNFPDALESDDQAWLVMPPPTQPRIALVHAGNAADPFVEALLSDLQPQSLEAMHVDAFEALDPRSVDAAEDFDMIVFDRVSTARLPGVPSLTFGGVPRGLSAQPPSDERGRRLLSWDRQHPVMRHVSLDPVLFAGFGAYELPPSATALASGPDGPVIALLRSRGARHVAVGFTLERSNWPMHVSIAVFIQNVLDYVTLTGSGQVGLVQQPGDPTTVRASANAQTLEIDGPVQASVAAEPGEVRSLPLLRTAGLYSIEGALQPMDQLAVSMLSDEETDLRPREQITVNAAASQGERDAGIVPRELWPWLVGAALVLLGVEWLVYLRKAGA